MTLRDILNKDLGNDCAYKIMNNAEGDFYGPNAESLGEFMYREGIDPAKLEVRWFSTEIQSGNKAVLVIRVEGSPWT